MDFFQGTPTKPPISKPPPPPTRPAAPPAPPPPPPHRTSPAPPPPPSVQGRLAPTVKKQYKLFISLRLSPAQLVALIRA